MDYADPNEVNDTQGDTGKQAQALQRYLDGDKTAYDLKQGMPAGYTVENGKVIQTGQWDQWGKGALEFFGPTLAESFIPGLDAATGAATGAGSKMSTLGTILKGIDTGMNVYGGLSDVLGGAADRSGKQTNAEDALKLGGYNSTQAAKRFALTAPNARRRAAFNAVLPKYAQPASVQWNGPGSGLKGERPIYSGGAKSAIAAAHDPQYAKMNDRVLQDELLAQMEGGASGGNMDAAPAPEVGNESALTKVLGGGALTTGLLHALLKTRSTAPSAADISGYEGWHPEGAD